MAVFDVPRSPLIDLWVASSLCPYNGSTLKSFVHTPFDTGPALSARRVAGSTDRGISEYDPCGQLTPTCPCNFAPALFPMAPPWSLEFWFFRDLSSCANSMHRRNAETKAKQTTFSCRQVCKCARNHGVRGESNIGNCGRASSLPPPPPSPLPSSPPLSLLPS